ncbi:transporter [Bradyrhizobium manausense]|uniref:ZIP family metal transporter n=1 Tax=Bradyrhizobium manausense TaxID=989370 RepID=UPI001BA5ACE1|nr:transporter [Bradyrhizobium manausense]MBR1090854.1 transporter [Bradyrhizobium manausense]
MQVWTYTLIPALAVVLGAAVAVWRRPSPAFAGAIQHFAAGVVFAAAAGELLPDIKHRQSAWAVILGGAAGVLLMLLIKRFGENSKGTLGLVVMVAVDIFIDGLVVGIGFAAGAKQGLLLTVALTIEVLFLGLSLTGELSESIRQPAKVLAIVAGLAILLPVGAAIGIPVSHLPNFWIAAFFSFGLVALLYLVTEELLVEAHSAPEKPWVTSLFFVGFLLILLLDELAG